VPLSSVALDEPQGLPAAEDLTGLAAMVKDETTCIRCGLCAARCPTSAFTMEQCALEQRPPDGAPLERAS